MTRSTKALQTPPGNEQIRFIFWRNTHDLKTEIVIAFNPVNRKPSRKLVVCFFHWQKSKKMTTTSSHVVEVLVEVLLREESSIKKRSNRLKHAVSPRKVVQASFLFSGRELPGGPECRGVGEVRRLWRVATAQRPRGEYQGRVELQHP